MSTFELTAQLETTGIHGQMYKSKTSAADKVLRLKNCKKTDLTNGNMASVKVKKRASVFKSRKSYSSEAKLSDFNPSYYPYLKRFQAAINKFASKYCEVCHKRLYERQVVAFCLTPGRIPMYLPKELTLKSFLHVCHYCNFHLLTEKYYPPSIAYWNNMDPGEIPQEVFLLSEFERRLIARYSSFLKIVDFKGNVGEQSCEAEAFLFLQNINEFDAQLFNKLPKSPESTDLVIVTKNMEQLDTVREYLLPISKCRISNALNWLIINNPLYKDVINESESMLMDSNDMLKQHWLINQQHNHPNWFQPFQFQAINNNARLLRASWNQSDETICNAKNAGAQCCAMALSAIIRAHITPPSQWTTSICNEWLFMGDELYEVVRVLCSVNGVKIPSTGFLSVKNFNVIKDYFVAFNRLFSIKFDEDPAIFGNLNNCYHKEGQSLVFGLEHLFEHHSCGILIASQKCYAVMKFKDKFYFADSHSCCEQGAPTVDDMGTGCLIECDSLYELHNTVRRATKSFNELYTLDYVDVISMHKKEEYSHNQPSTRQTNYLDSKNLSALPITTSLILLSDCSQVTDGATFDINNINATHYNLKEELEWYFLFPYGKNGLQEKRTVPITPINYFRNRILSIDLRFQHSDYLFYAFLQCEFYHIKSNLDYYALQSQQNIKKSIYIKNLHGSSAYWRTALNELVAQIRCLGPPHYFLTFSCIDVNWLDMRKALLIADGDAARDPTSLTTSETQVLIEKYPTIVCCHFKNRIKALLDYMKSDHLVLGSEVIDYWWRLDFQTRDTPHIQLLVWVSSSPDFNNRNKMHQLDKVMSCKLPEDSELKELVVKRQSHKHSPTCLKLKSSSSYSCNFPRSRCKATHIISQSSEEFFQNGGYFCVLKRKTKEGLINNYNLRLLKLWQGSMDIQPCGSIKAFAFYVINHIFKNIPTGLDKTLLDTLKQIQVKETDISLKLFKACENIDHKRKVSTFESVFRLCNFKLHGSSRQCVFLNTQKVEPDQRILKFGNGDGSEELSADFIKLYKKRPQQHSVYNFNSMCLLEFAMLFDPNCTDGDFNGLQHLPGSSYFLTLEDSTRMLIRSSPAVVTVPCIGLPSDPENYFFNLLRQYYPFRSELELFYGFKTARESFAAKSQCIKKQMSPLLKEHLSRDEELCLAFDQAHTRETENKQIFKQ